MREPDPIFGDLGADDPPPPLLPACLAAAHCFAFCSGKLQLLTLYHALHGIDDWELTTELFNVIGAAAPPRLF